MSVKICPEGGFRLSLEIGGEPVETQLIWREGVTYGEATVRTTDPKHLTKVVALLTNTLGGGLNIEFDQSLLTVEPGCAAQPSKSESLLGLSRQIIVLAGKLGIDLPDADDSILTAAEKALGQIAEQITQAQASELDTAEKLPPGAGPGETIDVNGPPQASIGGVAVGEAQAGAKRTRRTKAQIEADNAAEAAKKAASTPAAAPAPAPVVPAQPTPPNPAATAAFQEDLKAIETALPPPTTVPLKPVEKSEVMVETRVERKDDLDEMVDLLSNPPMPVELHPLDLKRSPADKQFLDTALVRLHFQYPLVEEYKADPNFTPANPQNSPVNMGTDEGVIALTHWLYKIAERAGQNGKPIGQLDMIFQLGTLEEVIGDAVEKVRKRREAAAAARRAAAAGQ